MLQKISYSLLVFIFIFNTIHAQEIWSLEKCIRHAQENNLSVKRAAIDIQNSNLTLKGSKASRLPNLNGSFSMDFRAGRSIDPITNSFLTQTLGSNGIGLSSNVILYNGGRIRNTIKQSEINLQASEANSAQTKNDISLNVAAAYLSVMLAEERLENAKNRLVQTTDQLNQIEQLIKAGSRPANDRLDILAAIATDEQAIVSQENVVDVNYINLKLLLLLDPAFDLKVERPNIKIPELAELNYELSDVYQTALRQQPAVLAGELNEKSALIGVDIAKAGKKPRLSLFGNVNSNYSSRARRIVGDGMEVLVDQTVFFNGVPAVVSTNETFYDSERTPYFNQLNENLGQSLGASLSIPIYNNLQNDIAIERAELNILQSQLTNQQFKDQLKSDIQRAIADAKAARKTLDASQRTVDAQQAAYENASRRFELGAINAFELTTSKNNLDQSKVNLIVAKYDYLFKLKIVDFYQGKTMTLD